jgi:hypothetical protein
MYNSFSTGYYSSERPAEWSQGYQMAPTPEAGTTRERDGRVHEVRNAYAPSRHDPGRFATTSCKTIGLTEATATPSRRCEPSDLVTRKRNVHWSLSGAGCPIIPAPTALKRSVWCPTYNSIHLTPTFTVNVRFDNQELAIVYGAMVFRANCLIDFEDKMRRMFPQGNRLPLSKALQKGYALVFFRRGVVKRVPVHIRGVGVVHPQAAFTGFLNSIPDGKTVALQWA